MPDWSGTAVLEALGLQLAEYMGSQVFWGRGPGQDPGTGQLPSGGCRAAFLAGRELLRFLDTE